MIVIFDVLACVLMMDDDGDNDYVCMWCEPAAQTREASVGGSGEHRPPRRRISGGSQASLCPRKFCFFIFQTTVSNYQ